jgi:hypothetical protein
MLVYHIGESHDISRAMVAKLEVSMNTIKEILVNEFKKEVYAAKNIHIEEIEKELQLQGNKFNVEFEQKDNINKNLDKK